MRPLIFVPAALIFSFASLEANASVVKTFTGSTSYYCSSSEAYNQYQGNLDSIAGRVANGDYGAMSYTENSELILGESIASSYSSCEKVLDENGSFDFYRIYSIKWQIDMHDSLPLDQTAYAHVYSDEECASLYEGSYSMSFPADSVDTDSVDLGSCKLQQTSFDGNGLALGVCTFSEDGATQSCYSDWTAVSTGEVNEISLDVETGTVGSDMGSAEKSEEVPDYLTETTDTSSCGGSSVSFGGASYCVDTSSVTVTDLSGSPWTGGGSGGGDGDGDGSGDGQGDGSGDGDGEGQCDPETDGECEGEATECLPGMSCYVPTDAQVEAKFFDYFPGSVDNTQVTEYDASDFELDGEYESGLTSGSCPAPVPVTLALGGNAHTFEITFEFFCQFALLIRGLVLASCSFLAANIIYRGVVTLV